MSDKDYLGQFINEDELQDKNESSVVAPAWAVARNNSLAAFKAILQLEQEKKDFILKNRATLKSTKKSNYLITKAAVASAIGCEPQSIFHSTSYGDELGKFFDKINENLSELKEKQVKKSKAGFKGKKKNELIESLKQVTGDRDLLITNVVDDVYKRTLDSMPLDVKSKLGLI